VKIILLKPGDEELLARAEGVFNSNVPPRARCAMLLREPSYVMVVAMTDDNDIMGRIYGNVLHRFEATDLLLYEVDVLDAHQRKGVGRAMLDYLSTLCTRRGYGEMWVLTEPDNEAGNALYKSAGGKLENSPTNMYVFVFARQ
jgi:ribosomal protein S18 acetylase RimI-like enzyme